MTPPASFDDYFRAATGLPAPYDWQRTLAENGFPDLIDIPCGWGKTFGAALSWAWRRHAGLDEPRHLVYCLPMRVLVEQTVASIAAAFDCHEALGFERIPVYTLMGDKLEQDWEMAPHSPWVLVGTQDQLLSRALNRGYTINRYRWPVHFGLLNNDARWILDEVQLMGPGLWTSAQLDWMRRDRFGTAAPCPTTWMSATIEPSFLATLDRSNAGIGTQSTPALALSDADRRLPHASAKVAAKRPIELVDLQAGKKASGWAELIAVRVSAEHQPGTLSLVVCNTVKHAQALFDAFGSDPRAVLLTSRFRKVDRAATVDKLLAFERKRAAAGASVPNDPGLIVVSTQVIEAGVDISAHRLWSEIGPWASAVQRIGRLNRDGSDPDAGARFWVPVADTADKTRKHRVGPYRSDEVKAAHALLDAVAPLSSAFPWDEALLKLRGGPMAGEFARATAPIRQPMPRAADVFGLFSTEPDVHGGFTDVSAFVRGDDPASDVTVFWRTFPGDKRLTLPSDPDGDPFEPSEGCQVTAAALSKFVKENKVAQPYQWDARAGRWMQLPSKAIRPGMLVLMPAQSGGYTEARGWTGRVADKLTAPPGPVGPQRALFDDPRTQRVKGWVPLTTHLADARAEAERLVAAVALRPELGHAVIEAAALHDWGKALADWQRALPPGAPDERAWAKAPKALRLVVEADLPPALVDDLVAPVRDRLATLTIENDPAYPTQQLTWSLRGTLTRAEIDTIRAHKAVKKANMVAFRPGLRHEAASALAMWHDYRAGRAGYPALSVYLAAAHHGKVRTVLRSTARNRRDDVMGVVPTDDLLVAGEHAAPMAFELAGDGAQGVWGPDDAWFDLHAHGWTAVVADLLGPADGTRPPPAVVGADEPRVLGPFALAYLEALVRIADWLASDAPSEEVDG